MFAWILFIFTIGAASLHSDGCILNISRKLPGVFLQKFGTNNLILDTNRGFIAIPEGTSVQGYCNSGFKNLAITSSPSEALTNVTFTCENGEVYYIASQNLLPIDTNKSLSCFNNEAAFYEGPISNCNKLGLAYGVNIDNVAVVFAEICYDIGKMEMSFIHFVAGIRSPLLENQINFGPSDIAYELLPNQLLTFDEVDTAKLDYALKKTVRTNFPTFEKSSQFDFDEIVPLQTYAGELGKFINSFKAINLAPWWVTLKLDNWKLFDEIIESMASNGMYDIYAGISGIIQYPVSGKCSLMENLTYKVGLSERTVPLYLWNYVKPRDANQMGTVVIGVNTPFFQDTVNNSAIFCTDECDSVDWLTSLSQTRKMPALGYIFCCNPQDVAGHLDGFPNF